MASANASGGMRADEWEQVKVLFNAALDLPLKERAAFVARSAGSNTALRQRLESLLAAHDDADDFLETPAAAFHAPELLALPSDGRVGAYRILHEIGRGGMGTVYLAERDDGEFRHQVAIKLVNRGMDTDLILRRFRHERQILAGLDHPNIARLLDGGTTDDGRPYFVMEYIAGEPIDEYAAARDLPVAERLRLFQSVCAAVQYAHQNLIVHRDIKASNILVTPSGTPKLLDFGIAKLLDADYDAPATAAPLTMRALTPEYASPEQVRGDPITTSSDVYSLGVLLYELLAGQRPYRLQSKRLEDITRAVCDTDPAPPSQAIAGPHASARSRQLRGDLDTIVLLAMQKDPRRRYGSVEQLSADIRRHLNGRPVAARRDSAAYRITKFVRRNRVAVAASAVVLISLLAGLAATMWEARLADAQRARAERRFAEVRTLATSFLFELHDAIAQLPGSTPARALLVRRALESLDGLALEARGDASLQRDLAAAYERVGQVQGNSYNSNLGDTKGAFLSYRKSLEIRERLVRDDPKSLELQNELAAGYHGMADMENTVGELTLALKDYERSLAIRKMLTVKQPANADNRADMAELYNSIGDTKGMDGYANLGDVAGAIASYRESVRAREQLLATSPNSRDYRVGVANSLMNLGYMLGSVADTSGATQIRRAIDIFERIVAEDPNDAKRRVGLLAGNVRLRFVLVDAGRLAEAVRVDSETIAAFKELVAADSSNVLLRRNLGATYNFLGRDLRSSGRPAEAVRLHRIALGIATGLASADPASSEHKHDVAITHYLLAEALGETSERNQAPSEYRLAAAAKEKLRLAEPTNTRHNDDLGLIYTGMANALTRSGDFIAARAAIDKAIPLAEAAVARSQSNQRGKANLANTYFAAARLHVAMASREANLLAQQASLRKARDWYEKSLMIWQTMQRDGRLLPVNTKTMVVVQAELSRCDSALAK